MPIHGSSTKKNPRGIQTRNLLVVKQHCTLSSCIFQQKNTQSQSADITKEWLRKKEALDRPVCQCWGLKKNPTVFLN